MLRCTARVLPVMGFIPMIGRAWKNPWGNVCTECRHSPVWPCLYTAQQTRSTRRSWHCLSTEGLKTDEDEDAGEEDFDFSSASNQLTVKAANREEKGKLHGGLYLVSTPIGNLEDITLRALRVLKCAHRILAEDTRHSRKLLSFYGIHTPMMSYHKFNRSSRQEKVVRRLQETDDVFALISDAGTPGISDPGAELVTACIEARVPVYSVPGPSAVIAALVASGLSTNEFAFVGFLPAQASLRKQRLNLAADARGTQVFYVPPHKLQTILDDCVLAFGGTRRCVVARELTKIHEEFWRGNLEEAQNEFAARDPKGEVTLLIAGTVESSCESRLTEAELELRIQSLLAEGVSPSEASMRLVKETSARRNVVYSLALRLAARKLCMPDVELEQ